jgi:hypothetical protein
MMLKIKKICFWYVFFLKNTLKNKLYHPPKHAINQSSFTQYINIIQKPIIEYLSNSNL